MSLPGLVLLEQKLFRITDIDVRLAAGQGLFTFMLTHRVSYFLGTGSRIHPEAPHFANGALTSGSGKRIAEKNSSSSDDITFSIK